MPELGASGMPGARFEIGAFGSSRKKGLVRMRRLVSSRFDFFTVLSILSLGFASVACGGSNEGDDDDASGGTGGTGGTGATGDAVTWDKGGWVDTGANPFGIQGPWYSYNDCANAMTANLPCTVPDAAIMGPDGITGWMVDDTKVCTKGTAAQVVMEMYSLQWGAGIALDLNSSGGENAVKGDFNAETAGGTGIKGFIFDITSNATPPAPVDLRVNIKTKATGDNSHFVTVPLNAKDKQVLFAEALQGNWVTAPTPLTVTAIESIQFQIYTNTSAPKPFDFCVSNMRAIRK